MAAADAFHLCQNHPFIDGNKRTALAAALVFLDINGITIVDYQSQLYKVMISLSTGRCSKAEFANVLKDSYIP
jgi:death on curing protein